LRRSVLFPKNIDPAEKSPGKILSVLRLHEMESVFANFSSFHNLFSAPSTDQSPSRPSNRLLNNDLQIFRRIGSSPPEPENIIYKRTPLCDSPLFSKRIFDTQSSPASSSNSHA
jgi:hypothetical protein